MDERLRNFYLEARVKNAAPGQILLMLYEALVENAENAEAELTAPRGSEDRNRAPVSIARCLDIITELSSALRYDADPELCRTLGNLYTFFARKFAESLATFEPGPIGAILPLLRELKVTWIKAEKISGQAQLAAAVA